MYDLILAKDDYYNDDARLFVSFLKQGSHEVTFEGLKAYINFLDSSINGKHYSASTFNKRLLGAKERLRYLFEKSSASFDSVTRYRFEKALAEIKPKKINSVAVAEDNILSEQEVRVLISESTDKTVSIMIEFLFTQG